MAVIALPLETAPSEQDKHLSLLQLFNLSAGIIGLQFAWSMQIALSSRILEPLGANPFIFGLIWCAGPITGLLIQPLVGAWSDRTWTRLGRRRPFVLAGALLGALAIFAFPFSTTLWVAALLTWVIDACLNTAQGPYRALVPDNAPPEQHAVANSFINFAFGAGSVIALGVAPLLKMYNIPMSVEQQYVLASIALVLTIAYASLSIQEVKPAFLTRSTVGKAPRKNGVFDAIRRFSAAHPEIHKLCGVQFITWVGLMCMYIYLTPFVVHHVYGLPDMSTARYKSLEQDWQLVAPIRQNLTTDALMVSGAEAAYGARKARLGLSDVAGREQAVMTILGALAVDPAVWSEKQAPALRAVQNPAHRLALAEAALMMPDVSAPEIQQPIAVLDKAPLAQQLAHLQYLKGLETEAVNTAQLALVAYNFVALLLTIPMGFLCARFGKKRLYSLSLLVYSVATAFAFWIHAPWQVIAMMAVAGVGGATILSLPFAMLCEYLSEGDEGTTLGIFNVFICAPQLISALGIGKLIEMSPMLTALGVTHQWWIAFATASLFVFLSMLALQYFKERYPGRSSAAVSLGH
ncbi:MFS transporter [Vampirovibrio sp.]|uniref:MFS transporter n=1 Tax=Vampirovibrio sp. TaxID=2717857 RepID=UPI003594396E